MIHRFEKVRNVFVNDTQKLKFTKIKRRTKKARLNIFWGWPDLKNNQGFLQILNKVIWTIKLKRIWTEVKNKTSAIKARAAKPQTYSPEGGFGAKRMAQKKKERMVVRKNPVKCANLGKRLILK